MGWGFQFFFVGRWWSDGGGLNDGCKALQRVGNFLIGNLNHNDRNILTTNLETFEHCMIIILRILLSQ